MWEKLYGWALCLLLFMKRAKSTGLLRHAFQKTNGTQPATHAFKGMSVHGIFAGTLLPQAGPGSDLNLTPGPRSLRSFPPLPNHSCVQNSRAWSSLSAGTLFLSEPARLSGGAGAKGRSCACVREPVPQNDSSLLVPQRNRTARVSRGAPEAGRPAQSWAPEMPAAGASLWVGGGIGRGSAG